MRAMTDVDVIIPCYGKSELINRGLASLATQWKREYIHVVLVDDCSPNTDCHYQDLVDRYKNDIDIRCIVTPENRGQGGARQWGIDHTEHQWFLFMDEDDMYTPLSISLIVGAMESYGMEVTPEGLIKLDKKGNPIYKPDLRKIGVVSAPLFEFDDNHTHVIESYNRIWLNAKLYNRDFLKKHNIRFNEAQSRHAEDYYFMSCFFYALDHDDDYIGILLDNEGLYYIWYPNEESQSRVDPHYGYMLSGYTMDGSVNILKFMRDIKTVKKTKETRQEYADKVLNMTIYSYFTFLSFLEHIKNTDYVPKLEQDWYILRDACHKLQKECLKHFDKFSYIRKMEEIFQVKNYSDVHYTEPWVTFDDYITNGMAEFEWNYETLMKSKEWRESDGT